MKYQIGDKVRIREDLEVGKEYGEKFTTFVSDMDSLKGKIAIIENTMSYNRYFLEENDYIWTDEMLEDKKEKENDSRKNA